MSDSINPQKLEPAYLDNSMATIKDIVTCLPKNTLSRNNRRVSGMNDEYMKNYTNCERNQYTFDHYSNSRETYSKDSDTYSSTSSSGSNQMNNLTKIIGQTNLNYTNIADKSKFFIFISIF